MRKRLLRLASSAHIRMTPSVETSMMSLATVEQNLLFKSSTELKNETRAGRYRHLHQPFWHLFCWNLTKNYPHFKKWPHFPAFYHIVFSRERAKLAENVFEIGQNEANGEKKSVWITCRRRTQPQSCACTRLNWPSHSPENAGRSARCTTGKKKRRTHEVRHRTKRSLWDVSLSHSNTPSLNDMHRSLSTLSLYNSDTEWNQLSLIGSESWFGGLSSGVDWQWFWLAGRRASVNGLDRTRTVTGRRRGRFKSAKTEAADGGRMMDVSVSSQLHRNDKWNEGRNEPTQCGSHPAVDTPASTSKNVTFSCCWLCHKNRSKALEIACKCSEYMFKLNACTTHTIDALLCLSTN